jgi:hypothetical protein
VGEFLKHLSNSTAEWYYNTLETDRSETNSGNDLVRG